MTTIFTAAMLALVTEVLGLPGRVSSSTENFPALKALTHLKTVRIEMVWGPYLPHNSLNICSRTGIIFNRKFPSFKSFNPPKNCAHWNGLRSIYTTQFIKYLLWIYIKSNAAFNIHCSYKFQSSGPCSNVTSKLVSVYDCIYFSLK